MKVTINGKQFRSIREAAEKVFGRLENKRKPGQAGVRYQLHKRMDGWQIYVRQRPMRVTLRRLRRWCLMRGHRVEILRRGLWVTR